MARRRVRAYGFTLIEVTLAIVIGVVMIAGAVLIYNQAKSSAGNSRAQAKVASLQQLVEEFSANNAGSYPSIEAVRSLFKRKRSDDYLKSPWGGQIGSHLQDPGDTGTRGIADNSTAKGSGLGSTNDSSGASPWKGDNTNSLEAPASAAATLGVNKTPVGSVPLEDQPKSGGLSYSLNDIGGGTGANIQNNTETEPIWDVVTNRTKIVRGYALWVYDQRGRYPNFASGGSAGIESSTTAGGGLRD